MFFDKYFIDINDLIENKNIVINRLDSISTLKLFDVLKNYNDYKNIYPNKNKLFYEVNYRFGFPLISIIVAPLELKDDATEGVFHVVVPSPLEVIT